MTDVTPSDVTLEGSGEQASSPPQEASSPEFVTKADLEAMAASISKQVEAGLRSNRQSANATIDNRVSGMQTELIESMKSLLPQGTDFEALQDQAWLRSQRKVASVPDTPVGEPPQAEPTEPSQPESVVEREIATILQAHGLSGDEPELRQYLTESRGKPWYQVGAGLNELAGKIASRTSDPGNIMGSPSGSPPSPDLRAQYIQEVKALMATGAYDQSGQVELRRIQDRYEKLGLDTNFDLYNEIR